MRRYIKDAALTSVGEIMTCKTKITLAGVDMPVLEAETLTHPLIIST
jgi:hypothetical protein